jgi:hypothetical protein
MISLYDNVTGSFIGTITEEQLQFLIDQFEEESTEDQDYFINGDELDNLQEAGADETLITLLRTTLGNRIEMEIRWARE